MIDLDAILARAEAATEGPWEALDPGTRPRSSWVRVEQDSGRRWTEDTLISEELRGEDAQFIAHARTDVPALVAEVKRLRELLGEVEWSGAPPPDGPDALTCSWCGFTKSEGHAPDCKLAAALEGK